MSVTNESTAINISAAPISKDKRIKAMDVLRGFALFGIPQFQKKSIIQLSAAVSF